MVSTIADVIEAQDHYTQSVYNRALSQLGIASFIAGNMFEVQQFLYDICSAAKLKESTRDVLKEYLAQGYSRSGDVVRSKTLPAYLHLNVETIETVELVASMLLEIPYTLTEGGRITFLLCFLVFTRKLVFITLFFLRPRWDKKIGMIGFSILRK